MASKGSKKPAGKAAELDASWLRATAGDALEAVNKAGEHADALVEAWVKQSNAQALDQVARSELPQRKAARRGLAVLKSRGVKLPEHKRAEASAVGSTLEAWFFPPDPSGVAVYTISSHVPGQRWFACDVRVHEQAGVVDVSVGEATKSSVAASFAHLKSTRGMTPTPVPVEWARWRVARARERNAKSGLILPLGLDAAAPLLTPVPEHEPMHPIDAAKLELTDVEIEKRTASSDTLHREPEFYGWLPDLQAVQQLLALAGRRVGAQQGEASQDALSKALDAEVAAAADRFFTPDVRTALSERMRDCAISVLARAGADRALDVLSAAAATKRAGLITQPPSDVPFLSAFFRKALAMMASSNGGRISIPVPTKPQAPAEAPAAEPSADKPTTPNP